MTASVDAVNGAVLPSPAPEDGPPAGHPAAPGAGAPTPDAPAEAEPAPRATLTAVARRMDGIEAEPVVWLWPDRIPTKLVTAAGPPGDGKSQVSLALAATVTTAGRWPDGTPCEPAGSVVLICGEDDAADTIKPRLLAAGADVTRVHVLDGTTDARGRRRPWLMEDGADALDALCGRIEAEGAPSVRLVVIDPITAYVGSKDGHSTSDVRGLLAPLMALADRRHLTVFAVTHLNKSAGADAMSRVTGSGAYVAAARVALVFGNHPHEEGAKCIAVAKTNLSPIKTSIGYRVVEADTGAGMRAPRVEWLPDVVDIDADALLAAPRRESDADLATESAKGDAVRFLLDLLADGPVRAPEVFERGDGEDIAKRTLERAKAALRVDSVRLDGKPGWWWRLPERRAPATESAPADADEREEDNADAGAPAEMDAEDEGRRAPEGGAEGFEADATEGDADATESAADGQHRQGTHPLAVGGLGGLGGVEGENGPPEGEGRQERQGRHTAGGGKGGGVAFEYATPDDAGDVERL